jgi:UDP-N-acetylglucosamine 2-epimerase (non-hydrolysing)
MKKNILLVFGTRPEAIKMAPLVAAFKERQDEFRCRICVTAQHRQMLDDVLSVFGIAPDHDLNIMQDGQSLFHVTAAALCRMEKVLQDEKPDLVLVHGDTTTTFAATLAAFYLHIPVGHVEAGLRSYNRDHPFPEEANRVLTDALCALYFAPTATARKALLREHTPADRIVVTGNTVIDALQMVLQRPGTFTAPTLRALFDGKTDDPAQRLILMTAHRRENFGRPFEEVFTAVRRIADGHPSVRIVYPVHLNPRVQEPAQRILGGCRNIALIPPVSYPDLALLLQRAHIVVTDSGGIQEEAPALGKPVLVLREVTERPEAVRSGTVRLAGTDGKKVYAEIARLLTDRRLYGRMSRAVNPYGDGKAAKRIVEAARHFFGFRRAKPAEFVPARTR